MEQEVFERAKKELKESLEEIRDRNGRDEEADHSDADDALLNFIRALGCEYEADIFEKIEKWYA